MKKISTNSSRKITNTNKYLSWMICMLLILVAATQNATAQTIPATNGTAGNTAVAPGWTSFIGTTDVSNLTGWAGIASFPWAGTITSPPTGHATWVDGFAQERAGCTITGLSIGTSYTFTFYAAELRSTAGGTVNNNYDGVLRLLNSATNTTLSTYNFTGGPSNAWNTFTYSFTAGATTLPIAFEYLTFVASNGNFWNVSFGSSAVSLTPVCNAGTAAPTLSTSAIANVCPATTVDLTTITASNLPASTTLTWHTATPATTANKIATPSAVAAGTYYAAFFDATNNCYSGTGGNGSATTVVTATTTTCAALTANNPSTQTVTGGQVYTGNAGTELAPTGGTGPYTYSNGSSDPACTNPGGGAVALPPASNLTVTNSTTGAYTYTAPTAAGTYFFCIKVCDSTTPTPSCVVKTYTVVVPCAAGNNAPVLIKN